VTPDPLAGNSPADTRIATLVQSYLAADYRWELDGTWHPLTIGECASQLQTTFPDARSYGLLSAWNPHSVERPDAENRAADAALAHALQASGLRHRAAFSSARNRTWREPSWIVLDMPLPAFDALALQFGQLATVHGERGHPARLRVYHAAPASAGAPALVDWVR
jgi:hypothetical protein